MRFLLRFYFGLRIKVGKLLCNIMIVFMVFNCLISALALARYSERQAMVTAMQTEAQAEDGTQEQSGLNEFLEEHFDDDRMEHIYPNAKVVN